MTEFVGDFDPRAHPNRPVPLDKVNGLVTGQLESFVRAGQAGQGAQQPSFSDIARLTPMGHLDHTAFNSGRSRVRADIE